MQDHDLIDIVPKNRRFTWSNCSLGKGNIMERLDRIMVNVTFLSSFSIAYATTLPFSTSDHYPTTLVLKAHCPLGPIPFKYAPVVEQHPNCQRNHSKSLVSTHRRITGLYSANREEEQKWRIKSRQLWLQGGDKNSAFFHKQAKFRKIRNNVTSIIDGEGNLQTTQGPIKKAAPYHYNALLTEMKEEEEYSDLLQYLPTRINKDINDSLVKEIEEEEKKEAI
eukprot:PITA_05338